MNAGCCCWLLLLIAGWLLVATGILLVGWLPVVAGILLAGEKVSENFRDIRELRLRQFYRRRSLWIFPGNWWFAAKTILPAKKTLITFAEVMRKFGWDKFWNCVRLFSEQKLSSRTMVRGKRRRVSPRGIRPVDCRQRLWKMRVYLIFISSYGAIEWLSNRRAPQVFVRLESGSPDVNCSADCLQNEIMSTYHMVRHVIMRYTTWPVTWSCKHGACLYLNIEPIALNHVPTLKEILLFLPLCNSNPSALFYTACYFIPPAPRLVNNVCSSFVKH